MVGVTLWYSLLGTFQRGYTGERTTHFTLRHVLVSV